MRMLSALLALCSTAAFGYNDHANWSAYRGGYGQSYQFTTGAEAMQSTVTTADSAESTSYRGLGLKTAMGVELMKFVRFDAYHLYQDTSANLSNSLRGDELGGDIKLSFYGPVVNVTFGLGLFGSSLVNQTPQTSVRYYGQGYTGLLGLERFLSPMVSIMVEAEGKKQSLKAENTEVTTKPEVNTVGLSLNLVLWLN